MQRIILACCWLLVGALPWAAAAQTTVQQSYATNGIQQVHLGFKYPELITVTTYTGNEVKVTANVSINSGQHNDRFQFTESRQGSTLNVNSYIANYSTIPEVVVVGYGGRRYTFANTEAGRSALAKFRAEHAAIEYTMNDVDTDIKITVQVPEGLAVVVDAKFGLVELAGNFGDVKVKAIHGGVDASFASGRGHNLQARTKFGSIYTNLNLGFSPSDSPAGPGEWEVITSSLNGGGRSMELESKFGNLYLRQQQ